MTWIMALAMVGMFLAAGSVAAQEGTLPVTPDAIILTIVSGEYGGEQGAAAADALLATAMPE